MRTEQEKKIVENAKVYSFWVNKINALTEGLHTEHQPTLQVTPDMTPVLFIANSVTNKGFDRVGIPLGVNYAIPETKQIARDQIMFLFLKALAITMDVDHDIHLPKLPEGKPYWSDRERLFHFNDLYKQVLSNVGKDDSITRS